MSRNRHDFANAGHGFGHWRRHEFRGGRRIYQRLIALGRRGTFVQRIGPAFTRGLAACSAREYPPRHKQPDQQRDNKDDPVCLDHFKHSYTLRFQISQPMPNPME